MKEIWKDIIGYEGLYKVSNQGRVKRLYRNGGEKILKAGKTTNGYLQVALCKEGKPHYMRVHRLVAQHFLPNPNNLSEVNHIDENKDNNCISNLEWCTRQYNASYGSLTKAVLGINLASGFICIFNSITEASKAIGGTPSNISACCRGIKGSVKGYKWIYVTELITTHTI